MKISEVTECKAYVIAINQDSSVCFDYHFRTFYEYHDLSDEEILNSDTITGQFIFSCFFPGYRRVSVIRTSAKELVKSPLSMIEYLTQIANELYKNSPVHKSKNQLSLF